LLHVFTPTSIYGYITDYFNYYLSIGCLMSGVAAHPKRQLLFRLNEKPFPI
jgi:hypothetical protein